MSANVDWTKKTPAGVKIIRDRREYEKAYGHEAPPPDFLRLPQYWCVELLPAAVRRYDYTAIALGPGATPLLVQASDDPSPERRAFYAELGILTVPVIEARQITRGQALAVNLPWDVSPAGDTEPGYAEWLHSGIQETPIMALAPNEAFLAPAPFQPIGIVDMALYKAEHPGGDTGSGGLTRRQAALLEGIARKIGVEV